MHTLLMSILCLSKIRLGVKPLLALGRPVANTNYECTDQSIINLSLVLAVSSTPTAHSQLSGSYYSSIGEELEQAAFYNFYTMQNSVIYYYYYCSSKVQGSIFGST